jgi:hypothetical protein
MSDTEAPQNPQLEAFLASGTPEPPAPDPGQTEAPKPEPKSDPKPPPQVSPPVSPAAEDDDHDDGSGHVPVAAHRKMREDWKAKHAAAEARADELRRQLEAIQKGPPAAAAPPQTTAVPPPPDPRQDPAGYHRWVLDLRANDNLNWSEAMLRSQVGDAEVDRMVEEFKQMGQQDEGLYAKLKQQANPYAWAYKQVQAQRLLRDVGSDPDAYRAKMRAEIEAEYAAKMAQAAPQSPAAGIPPSLATVRSSAPRGQVFNGPPPIEDVVGKRSGDLFARHR